jgi:hypothetical protein
MTCSAPHPAPEASWQEWSRWLADQRALLGAYEQALSPDQLRPVTAGLAALEQRLWQEYGRTGWTSPRGSATREASQLLRRQQLARARRQLDEGRLLVGQLCQRARVALYQPEQLQAGIGVPDRLRQRARRALEQLLEELEELAQTEPEGGHP